MARQLLITLVLLVSAMAASAEIRYRVIDGAGGLPLQMAEAGEQGAPGILFIHGSTLSLASWQQQFESSLSDNFHLVAFDLRGHGNSGKPWDSDSYESSKLWADDVAAVIAAGGLEKPVIVAWSYGGHVTLDYLRHYPADSIAGLILVGSTGGMLPFPPPDAETAAEFARLGALSMSANAGDRLAAARLFVDGMLVDDVPADIREREVASILAVTPYVRSAWLGRDLDNSDMKSRLSMPVLFINGDAERAASGEAFRQLAAELADARVSVYENTGHMPFIEQQQRFDSELIAFVAKFTGKQNLAD